MAVRGGQGKRRWTKLGEWLGEGPGEGPGERPAA